MNERFATIATPRYCQYSAGPCDQAADDVETREGFFIYPSQPAHLASTVYDCIAQLQKYSPQSKWLSWESLRVGGQIIFCAICKAIRGARCVVANITSLNFNVLFEFGFSIGLAKAVLPVRDTSYEAQKRDMDEIGVFDTLGYEPFSNSGDLQRLVRVRPPRSAPVIKQPELNREQPVYYIRSPLDNDGSVTLFSCLKKSWFRFRTFDTREQSRISLHDAFAQTLSSAGVIAHLIDPERAGATTHNARCAFLCGMALASGRHVLMLQEGQSSDQPIDYRDIIMPYVDAKTIPTQVEGFLRNIADTLQSIKSAEAPLPRGLLERVDLGDVAAENEIQALQRYFVKTPQYQQARQGHARIVIGRKGSGKTALFYAIRNLFPKRGDTLVLDLKPEGHQFTRLRERVLGDLSDGLKLHTLTAFWHYLLLLEVANKVLDRELKTAYQNAATLQAFEALETEYLKHVDSKGDFSERLMALVNRVADQQPISGNKATSSELTSAIYKSDIHPLEKLVLERLQGMRGIWVLFDNIDKGFPTHGLQKEDAYIIRCLLEATRKLQQSLDKKSVECVAVVFIRRDVYDHLVDFTPDRGKETFVSLDWSDTELLRELLLRRFVHQVPELTGGFEEVWSRLFNPHVKGENSFGYILSRTFLRPRDVLNFSRKCVQIAVSRGHERVEQEDILRAEKDFSEDMVNELRYEIRDTYPQFPDLVLSFIDAGDTLTEEELNLRLLDGGISEQLIPAVKEILLWFSFLGVRWPDREVYSYQLVYDMVKLRAVAKGASHAPTYCIHPAFRSALRSIDTTP